MRKFTFVKFPHPEKRNILLTVMVEREQDGYEIRGFNISDKMNPKINKEFDPGYFSLVLKEGGFPEEEVRLAIEDQLESQNEEVL